jgi:hypothetical protein
VLVPDEGQFVVIQTAHLPPVKEIGALGRLVQTSQDIHQRGFSRARGSHNGDELVAPDVQVDPIEGKHRGLPHQVGLFQVGELQHGKIPVRAPSNIVQGRPEIKMRIQFPGKSPSLSIQSSGQKSSTFSILPDIPSSIKEFCAIYE